MTTHVTPQVGAATERSASEPIFWSRSRAAWAGLLFVTVGSVSVFWAFSALPFQDLPAHAGLIAMRHRFAASSFEQHYYVYAPHVGPYSLFRFLGEALLRVEGPTGVVRTLASLPVVATPAALMFARRRLFGDTNPAFGFVGLALSFGLMTLLGFASYLLGVAVMLVGLTLWLDMLAADDAAHGAADHAPDHAPDHAVAGGVRRRELAMTAFAPLVFVAHGHAFLLLLLCVAVSLVANGWETRRLVRVRAFVPALLLAGWVAWSERGSRVPEGSVFSPTRVSSLSHDASEKIGLLFTPTLMTRTGIDSVVGVGLWALALGGAIATLRGMARHRAHRASPGPEDRDARPEQARTTRSLFASAAALGGVFVVLPHSVGWFGFVDGRLVPLIVVLLLLGVQREHLTRWLLMGLDVGAPIAASTLCAVAFFASYKFQGEAEGYADVLAHVPAETRLLNLPLDPDSDIFAAHPFVHYDKLVLADRPVVVSDVWFHQGSALYPTAQNPSLHLPTSYSESDLRQIDWPAYELSDWDWVLIRTRPNAMQPATPHGVALEEHRGGWWLFRVAVSQPLTLPPTTRKNLKQ